MYSISKVGGGSGLEGQNQDAWVSTCVYVSTCRWDWFAEKTT